MVDIEKILKSHQDDDNKKVVGCFPLYPPLEIFSSLGFVPITLWNIRKYIKDYSEKDKHLQSYVCSIGHNLTEFVLKYSQYLSLIFIYNACDTIRNLPEIIQEGLKEKNRKIPISQMHIPVMQHENDSIKNYLGTEITNLIIQLEEMSGNNFEKDTFVKNIKLYNKVRKYYTQLENYVAEGRISFNKFSKIIHENNFIPVEDQISKIEGFIDEIKDNRMEKDDQKLKKVFLSGILPPSEKIIGFMEDLGFRIVANDIASLSRSYSYIPEINENPSEFYWDFYKNHIPCSTLLYSSDDRVSYVMDLIRRRDANGHIFIGEKFCEYEYFELPYLEKTLKKADIPSLSLEFSFDDYENVEAFKTRIEAFAEVLDEN
ncbi:MAG: hypothetical protein GF329_04075 [Candidatus Lokiarchaeota archaeon]|nr:hypothetical protein [Candidatus Lokiarchaeota archaeon]